MCMHIGVGPLILDFWELSYGVCTYVLQFRSFLLNKLLKFILILTCCFRFSKSLDAGVCIACTLRGTNRGPQVVHSDLEQGRYYGSLLIRCAECEHARLIDVQAQGE